MTAILETKTGEFFGDRAVVVKALVKLLDAIETHPDESLLWERVRPMTMAELEERQGLELLQNPVGSALREAVREIGKKAGARMTAEEMLEICEEVASSSGHWGIRTDVIDKAWDGIVMKDGDVWIC